MPRLFLILLLAGLILAGCQSSTKVGESDLAPISPSKLQPCQVPSPLLSGSHQEVERWAVEQGYKYRDCVDRQAELAETVKLRQKMLEAQNEKK